MSGYSGQFVGSAATGNMDLVVPVNNQGGDGSLVQRTQILDSFKQFIRNFLVDDNTFYYRDRLRANYLNNQYFLEIDLQHLLSFKPELHELLTTSPTDYIPLLEQAIREVYVDTTPGTTDPEPIQAIFVNYPRFSELRRLSAADISRLISIRGIITSASKPRVKATTLCIMCRTCKTVKKLKGGIGFSNIQVPRKCDSERVDGEVKCPMDPFVILADECEYMNVQTLKLQEAPEAVPTGEMPRHVTLTSERYLVGQVKPGTRVSIIGIHATFTAKQRASEKKSGVADVGIRIPYVRAIGIEQESESSNILMGNLQQEEIMEIQELVRNSPDIYEEVAQSIAPAIMGRDDIKKAIACCLFGGSRKALLDGMKLRGDINVLLLGDPSVAKSQFLKYAAQAAPISVYTSGKGSSAAGLTASVIRSAGTGEFHLEGGALVLADGGLVCIDEFDKMREQDRVAIHEAMEQQTISIAKAGITTILNSRTSVLAAANPVFGRYDDTKDASDNIDFQATILSRFDLIFIIRDMQDEDMDSTLARHIINVHAKKDNAIIEANQHVIPVEMLKKYIAYSRRIEPRLTDSAAELLKNRYVSFRKDMADRRREDLESNTKSGNDVIPITVRQLEAIIRLSESIARMNLLNVVTEDHVNEALRLFKVATLQAASTSMGEALDSDQFRVQMQRIEQWFRDSIGISNTVSTRELMRNAIRAGHDERATKKAMEILVQRRMFKYENQRKFIRRLQ